ncbi:MAG: hypothetical protein KI792_12510 [Alphaproteobacteria bacterium]|nr:hypothetical protein [Alphaproteobacteria bacterium SS10]
MKSLLVLLAFFLTSLPLTSASATSSTDFLICQAKQLEDVARVAPGIDEPAAFIVEVLCRDEALAVARTLAASNADLKALPRDEALDQAMDLVLRQTRLRIYEYRRNR